MKNISKLSEIKTTIFGTDDGTQTFEIRKEFFKEGKPIDGDRVMFIGMFPTTSIEQPFKTDNTTLHLVSRVEELGISSLSICNLFSKVSPVRMSSKNLAVDEENISYIKDLMKSAEFKKSKVLIGWGNSMKTSTACIMSKRLVVEMFKEIFPDGNLYQLDSITLKELDEPVHPLFMGIRHKNERWKLVKWAQQRISETKVDEGVCEEADESKESIATKSGAKRKPKLIYEGVVEGRS